MKCLKGDRGKLNEMVDPTSLARAICKTEEVQMKDNFLTTKQLNSIFSDIANYTDLRLKILNLDCIGRMGTVLPAVSRLTEINFYQISEKHLNVLLHSIYTSKDSNLKKLGLGFRNLSGVLTDILTKAISRLEDVDLTCTHLSTRQSNALFDAICEEPDIKLQSLNLSTNNFAEVESELLADSVCNLKKVDLTRTQLKTSHLNILFDKIAKCSKLTLQKLTMIEEDLSEVSGDPLAHGVCRLEHVILRAEIHTMLKCISQKLNTELGQAQLKLELGFTSLAALNL